MNSLSLRAMLFVVMVTVSSAILALPYLAIR
jgi:hypothetical protein